MVRGIRTPLRGAVAASSAIFFFSLANMVILSTSLSLSMQDVRLHVVQRALGLMAPQARKEAVPRRRAAHFLPAASGNGKR